MNLNQWFAFTGVFFFVGMISFFQVDSAWADEHNFNGILGWSGIGIASILMAVFGLYKSYGKSNSK